MTRNRREIINHVLLHLPREGVITATWLKEHGVSNKLAWWYSRSGFIERIGKGAYKKEGEQLRWHGAIAAVQQQLHLPVHIAGKTALELLGMAHFIPFGETTVTLFASHETVLPLWFKKTKWDANFSVHNANIFESIPPETLVTRNLEGILLILSSPELAILELLHLVPHKQSFSEATLIMENLAYLRPNLVQALLESCTSIKVKRLFLYLADKNHHEWLSQLNIQKLHLGHGKRVIGAGGVYDAKYQLSVPPLNNEDEDVSSELLP